MIGKRGQSTGSTSADPEKNATISILMKTLLVIILILVISAILYRSIKLSGLAG